MLTDATSLDCYAEESEDGLSYSVAIIVSKVDNYVHLWQCIHHSSFHQVKKKYTAYMPGRCSLGPSFRECLLPPALLLIVENRQRLSFFPFCSALSLLLLFRHNL